jgi:hypothetical protein
VSATQQPVSDRWTRATELFVAWREGTRRPSTTWYDS